MRSAYFLNKISSNFIITIFFFFFFFLFKVGEGEKGNYKGGSFPQLILTEEKKEQDIGMLPKIRLEAAHLAS
jgi:hypothetical protein